MTPLTMVFKHLWRAGQTHTFWAMEQKRQQPGVASWPSRTPCPPDGRVLESRCTTNIPPRLPGEGCRASPQASHLKEPAAAKAKATGDPTSSLSPLPPCSLNCTVWNLGTRVKSSAHQTRTIISADSKGFPGQSISKHEQAEVWETKSLTYAAQRNHVSWCTGITAIEIIKKKKNRRDFRHTVKQVVGKVHLPAAPYPFQLHALPSPSSSCWGFPPFFNLSSYPTSNHLASTISCIHQNCHVEDCTCKYKRFVSLLRSRMKNSMRKC